MRYRIEANLYGKGYEDLEPHTVYTDDHDTAKTVFNFFLTNDVRPVRLIDTEGEHYIMKAENGIRTGC